MSEPLTLGGEPARVSVVVPARNCPGQLRYCLTQLAASACKAFEVIVVDDESTDDTASVAEEFGAQLLRLPKRQGPAGARNEGAALAKTELLYFVDADVGVHTGNIGAVLEAFDHEADLDALFGSYDTVPSEPNFISQYRNLFHHYVHQQGHEEASTFWSGCGAIRRQLFLDFGGFDPGLYDRPAIEDIELGVRLVKAGHRIAVKKAIQVTHLKRWTLWPMVRTDVFDRGIPWTRLILREGNLSNDLNTSVAQRVSLLLVAAMVLVLGVAAWFVPLLLLLPVFVVATVAIGDRYTLSHGVTTSASVVAVGVGAALLAWSAWLAPVPTAILAGLVGAVALLNLRFYAFYAQVRGILFAAAVLPMHILYYFYSGVSFAAGMTLHLLQGRRTHAS
ncbi:MAG: GT2 family glycosyltransferase [Pseudohongiellaceae bacterium]